MSSSRAPTPPTPPKTVLICPDCGHESPLEGDWRRYVRETAAGERLVYECPDCGATIARRGVPDDAAGGDA